MDWFDDNEKSACGVGFVANRNNEASHGILQQTLTALECQEHRGGCASDLITADGSGIMTDIPFDLLGYEKGTVAVASLFLPTNAEYRRISLSVFEDVFDFLNLKVAEYREVPVDKSVLGPKAAASLPYMTHAIILRPEHCRTDFAFERMLYQARMYTRIRLRENNPEACEDFFFNSLSANTIVYKGLLRSADLGRFYLDLQNPAFKTRFGLFHRRFSTNTISTWDKAQPFRFIAHNGEINTITGNRSGAFSREKALGLRREELLTRSGISDSGSMNEMVEALTFRSSLPHIDNVLAIMMPPADPENKYYKFWSRVMEPWDGPALISFSDGFKVGARLDRNGFRPCRWTMTEEHFFLASEAGSFNINPAHILSKGSLNAGTGVAVNLLTGEPDFEDPSRWVSNAEAEFDPCLIPLEYSSPKSEEHSLAKKYFFSYSEEDISRILIPMMANGKEPIGSMGDTARPAVFSDENRSFFDFFYQTFAQVTNPPLDFMRERNVTDLVTYIGKRPNIFSIKELIPPPQALMLKSPVLSLGQMEHIRSLSDPDLSDKRIVSEEFDITFLREHSTVGLENALVSLGEAVVHAVNTRNVAVIILTDRRADFEHPPLPALLALRVVIQGLTEAGVRLEASLVLDTAQARTTHDVACLIGFGATAVCPYLALETARYETAHKISKLELEAEAKELNMLKAFETGLLKIMSKMGISVVRAYQSAKLFSIVGLNKTVTDRFFPGTYTYLGGLTLKHITESILIATEKALEFEESGSLFNNYLFREDTLGRQGEKHSMTFSRSKIVHKLVKETGLALSDPELFEKYLEAGSAEAPINIRHLFALRKAEKPLAHGEVEDRSKILARFGSGAMSFGAISAESQRDIILAMREIGGRSNSGEGGENPYYFNEGISATTKQVASGRFGVTALYLISGEEIQIKVAQGAKPGEGGQLMGIKVNADIARARFSNKNVDLISPPPLHDIYSIEDLKELIYELKQLSPEAEVSVKLVSGANVGTIAVGVAKAGADAIDIVGGDGGTGAAGLTSMKHAGLPWEFGLTEAHKALVKNDLRTQVKLRTDGGLSTGEDIVFAALLGAEQFNFGKLLLVAQGCVMARICEKNTCPAGITTHDPVYKAKYKGTKDQVVKMMNYLAEDVRRHLAKIGLHSLDEAIGRADLLMINPTCEELVKERKLDLSFALGKAYPVRSEAKSSYFEGISDINTQIVKDTAQALENNESLSLSYNIAVTDRAVPATLAGEIAKKENKYRMNFYNQREAFYPYTKEFKLNFRGSAGQGFGVFMTDGMNIRLEGEANDSVAKSMSGGSMTIVPPQEVFYAPEDNVIVGNCALYGATGGVLFVNGLAADRFAVRNSGAYAVVEGVGLHACEYMTNGKVVILGEFYQNLGSGMTGGALYLYKPHRMDYINREYLTEGDISENDYEELYNLLTSYRNETGSNTATRILSDWYSGKHDFVKLIPLNTVKTKVVKKTFSDVV